MCSFEADMAHLAAVRRRIREDEAVASLRDSGRLPTGLRPEGAQCEASQSGGCKPHRPTPLERSAIYAALILDQFNLDTKALVENAVVERER